MWPPGKVQRSYFARKASKTRRKTVRVGARRRAAKPWARARSLPSVSLRRWVPVDATASQPAANTRPAYRLAHSPRQANQPAGNQMSACAMAPSIQGFGGACASGPRARCPRVCRAAPLASFAARQRQLLGVRAHGSLSGSLSGSIDFDEPTADAAAAAVERLVLSAATSQQLPPTASAWLAQQQDTAAAPAADGTEEGADGAAGSTFARLLEMIPVSPRTRGILMLNLLVLLVASNWVSCSVRCCFLGCECLCARKLGARLPHLPSCLCWLPGPGVQPPRLAASWSPAARPCFRATPARPSTGPHRRWWSKTWACRTIPLASRSCASPWRRQL